MKVKVGVLAVQGSFSEHVAALKNLDRQGSTGTFSLEVVEVRSAKDVTNDLKGMIIPGGESTTLDIFLRQDGFFERLKVWMTLHPVVWGTCAGMILLSDKIEQQKSGGQLKFGGMPITTSRNSFGRQRESFVADIFIIDKKLKTGCNGTAETFAKIDETSITEDDSKYPGIFIRAPGIISIEKPDQVEVLATLQIGVNEFVPVALRRENLMVTSFHPELTQDLRFHKYFIQMISEF